MSLRLFIYIFLSIMFIQSAIAYLLHIEHALYKLQCNLMVEEWSCVSRQSWQNVARSALPVPSFLCSLTQLLIMSLFLGLLFIINARVPGQPLHWNRSATAPNGNEPVHTAWPPSALPRRLSADYLEPALYYLSWQYRESVTSILLDRLSVKSLFSRSHSSTLFDRLMLEHFEEIILLIPLSFCTLMSHFLRDAGWTLPRAVTDPRCGNTSEKNSSAGITYIV